MSVDLVEIDDMAKKLPNTSPVRLSDEAIKWARIASGYTGGQEDADRLHAQVKKPAKDKGSAKP
jgi:hypothetical protein